MTEPAATAFQRPRVRFGALVTIALGLGLAIALIDSGPGWDDTGVTVGLIGLASAGVAFASGRQPWLWALLVGSPLPALEIATSGATGSIAALVFAAIGAAVGFGIAHARQPRNA